MENIIYERDYAEEHKSNKNERAMEIFEQAINGGFMKDYQEAMDAIPKVIDPEYKANYEYLLQICDDLAKRWGGSVRGVVDHQRWDSKIELVLPYAEFSGPKDLQILREMAEKSHSITIESAKGGGIRIYIYDLYFKELISDAHRGYIEYEAILKDEKLAEMLGMPTEPSPEILAVAEFYNDLLDRVEEATGRDRDEIFREILDRAAEENDLEHIIECQERIAQELIDEVNDRPDDT